MPTRREFDHLGAYNFKIEIEGVTVGAFGAIEGMEATTEVINYADGDNMILRKRPGRTTYSNIVLKRGFTNNEELWTWYKQVIDGQVQRKAGSVIILGEDGSEIMRYNFFESWPCRWKNFVMNAQNPGLLVEELEIAVEKIERG
jgi:phage tail-like protein